MRYGKLCVHFEECCLCPCVLKERRLFMLCLYLGEINQADERGEWESEGLEADQGKRIESVETKG